MDVEEERLVMRARVLQFVLFVTIQFRFLTTYEQQQHRSLGASCYTLMAMSTAVNEEPASASSRGGETAGTSRDEENQQEQRAKFWANALPVGLCGLVTGTMAGAILVALVMHFRSQTTQHSTEGGGGGYVPQGFTIVPAANVCFDKGCEYSSRILRTLLNPYLDPCNNFYEYVCGRFQSPVGTLVKQVEAELGYGFSKLLSTTAVPASRQSALQKAVGLTVACLEVLKSKRKDISELTSFMRTQGMALRTDDMADAVDRLFKLSFYYDVNVFFEADIITASKASKNKRTIVIAFNSGHADWLQQKQLMSPDDLRIYYTQNMVIVGIRPPHSRSVIRAIVDAESEVANLLAQVKGADKLNSVTIRDLGSSSRSITTGEWLALMRKYVGSDYTEGDVVYASIPIIDYFSDVKRELGNEKLNVLLAWELVRQLGVFADHHLAATIERQHATACVSKVLRTMAMTLAIVYFSRVLPPGTTDVARNMTAEIREELIARARASTLVQQKAQSLKQLADMKLVVGFPEDLDSEVKVNEFWKTSPQAGQRFLQAYLATVLHWKKELLRRTTLALFPMVMAQTYYDPADGVLYVPPPILGPPFFDVNSMAALNYAGFGHFVGRRIADVVQATAQGQCPPDGVPSLAALRAAYTGYTRSSGASEDKKLPLLTLPPQKLFFAMACVKMCAVRNVTNTANADSCNGLVRNVDGFAAAFGCAPGTPMNPASKCNSW